MSGWIERIKKYDDAVDDLKSLNKACVDKETDKTKLRAKIKALEEELKKTEELRKVQILEEQAVIQEKQNLLKEKYSEIFELKKEKTELSQNFKKAEAEIKSLRRQISVLTNEKTKLEESVEFLKNNRRSPNIEELKDYTEKRKRKETK